MKKNITLFAILAVLLLTSCVQQKPAELYVPKNTVEFAGNAFTAFSLGGDVKIYATEDADNPSKRVIQAVVPIRKETDSAVSGLKINLTPLDDRGIRVREGFALEGEDLDNLLPVYNAGSGVERTIVFSLPAGPEGRKLFSSKEAAELLGKIKGVRMDFNVENTVENEAVAAPAKPAAPAAKQSSPDKKKEEFPMTLDGLCRKYGIYGYLARYEAALKNGDKKGAKKIEDQLWEIEKRVKNDKSIPENLRDRFKDYVEDKEDEIEDRY